MLVKILSRFTRSAELARGLPRHEVALLVMLILTLGFPWTLSAKSNCDRVVGFGPLRLTSQSPFQSLRLGLVQRTPSTLEEGQVEVRTTTTWANVWANGLAQGTFFLDYETLEVTAGFVYGLSDRLQISLELEDRSRFGGGLDGLVQGFHDFFDLRQDGRDEVPKDQLTLRLAPDGGVPVVDLGAEASGSFSRMIVLGVQQTITCGDGRLPALSYAVTGRWGVGNRDFETRGGLDLGVSVAAAERLWQRWYGYLTVGFSRYRKDKLFGIALRKSQYSVLGAIEWRRRPKSSLVLQWLHSEGAARDFGPFSESTNEVSIGWKRQVGKRSLIEAGLIENLVTFENSPDFGIHIGFSQRF